jgi:hypothetical protein
MSLFADGKPVEIPNFTEATRPRSSDRVTLTARTLNSMCVEPFLVFEQRAKQQRNLPMMISFGTGRKRTGMAQNVAPMLKKVRLAVERLVYRQHTSNRRHGSHLFAFQSPGDAGE